MDQELSLLLEYSAHLNTFDQLSLNLTNCKSCATFSDVTLADLPSLQLKEIQYSTC